MSSADPTDANSPAPEVMSKPSSSKMGSRTAYEQATEEVAHVTSERPQAKPADRKTDRAEPQADPVRENGPKGIKGAFRKHPVAMIVCLGLIAPASSPASPGTFMPVTTRARTTPLSRPAGAGQSAGYRQHHQRQCHR